MTLDKLQRLVSLDPNDALSRFALGKKLYETSQNLPEAADHLRFAHRKDPTHLATYYNLAKVLIALGEKSEARQVLTEGLARTAGLTEGMGRDLGPYMQTLLATLDTPPTTPKITTRLARPEEVVDLRWRVLRAGLPREAAIFPGDDAPTTLHALAEIQSGGGIACCATVMLEPHQGQDAFRLRGMATDEQHRGLRLGRAVLTLLESESQKLRPTRLLWCNARIGAVRFYQSQGWQVTSETPYDIPTAGLHHTMVKHL